ncbi:MAG TPA: exodeoxyribonuclease V subunit gamma [Clostridiales bacterium]|nr:exodeoxyribonuclease V subunit gamma [Clostridiales bacterium]HPP34934.1 exodeoxyribonuclease V subunit gamma [Clostridiales bacterium]
MGLRIVYGRAGSGKSSFCYNEIRERASTDGNAGKAVPKLLLIVPEQFSLQAEKNLARITGASGIYRAEVLSFRRLAYRVFSEVGGVTRRHIDSAGKSMLLFRILDRLGSELKVFSRAALRKGFIESLSDAITEFKRYDIAPEALLEAASGTEDGSLLKDKLHDLSLVYSEFEKQLHQNYLDADDDLVELYKKLDLSTQYDGAEIWIDEFSGFTPQEYKVIGKLLVKAARVTICMCTDCLSDDPNDSAPMVFGPVRKTAEKLLRLAEHLGVHVEKPVRLDGVILRSRTDSTEASPADPAASAGPAASGRDRKVPDTGKKTSPSVATVSAGDPSKGVSVRFIDSEAIGHLERNFWKYPYSRYTKQTDDIHITASANPYSEVEDAARDILRICRDHGFRFRDIAVTMRNPDDYSSIIKSVFARYGIPYFLDGKRDIDGHPLIVFILSALEIFTGNWSYEAVFRYAKTGLLSIGRQDLDILENYVLANGIRGSMWTREDDWDYPVGYDERKEPSEREPVLLERINAARRELVAPLISFRAKTKGGARAVTFCTALYDLLCETGAAKRIEELSEMFADTGMLDRANEYRQVWNTVMDVFTQIVEVLGEETVGTERFSDILSVGFAGHKMGLIPPSLDQVLVGSMERARSHDIKALYILGANEGVLPGNLGGDSLLSDSDRDSLARAGLELPGNTQNRIREERFMIYMALATPSRYLRLSYPAADRDGRALRPSRVISEIKRIMPSVTVKSNVVEDPGSLPQPSAPEPVFDEMVSRLRRLYDGNRIHDGWKRIYGWFNGRPEWKDKCRAVLSGLDYTNQAKNLTKDRALKLYGNPVFTSVSRMETYAACPFSFFVKYGLKAKERKVFSFEQVDAGTFMHNIIDEFSRSLVKNGKSWRDIDEEWCRAEVSKLVDRYLSGKGRNVLGSSKRYLYLSDRLKRTVVKSLMLISKHIAAGSFEPSGYEVEFGQNGRYPEITIELPSGEMIKLTGRIDRIDTMKGEDGTYLRIIDYKSGSRALKLGDVYYGLQLQLITYMDAVLGQHIKAGSGSAEDDTAKDAGPAHGDPAGDTIKDGCATYSPDKAGEQAGENGKGAGKLIPAGALYFRLSDPLIRCGRDSTEEEIEKAIMKELRMKGLVLADVKLIREMDKDIAGDSLIIPARINKDGSLGRSSAATEKQFRELCGHVRKLLGSIGKSILDGNVAVNPYKRQKMTACEYCVYSSVCQFDTAMRDNRYRYLADLDDDEVWRLIGGRNNGADDAAGHAAQDTAGSAVQDSPGQDAAERQAAGQDKQPVPVRDRRDSENGK